jgi:putative transport protein
MNWFHDLLFQDTIAHTILIYSIIIATGVFLGKIKVFGISLGVTFVLFAGIAAGHFGFSASREVIDFIREFGLILFVFSIGLQVGPGFFSSFRKGGLSMNLLAMSVVILGVIITIFLHFVTGTSMPMMVGIMSGAVTNTPGLGAAQQALVQVASGTPGNIVPEIGIGYAVAYPFGVLGIILTMFLIRKFLSINIDHELAMFNRYRYPDEALPEKISIRVTNEEIFGGTIYEITGMISHEFIISRVCRNGETILASSDTVLNENDVILVVTQKKYLPEIVSLIGRVSEVDMTFLSGRLIARQIMVTNRKISGRKIGTLRLRTKYNINITRIYRAGIEFVATPGMRLQMGDKVLVVGEENSMENVTAELGNSIKRLNEPNLIPIFIGILAGVLLGNIPVHLPGVIRPFTLGLAGGPLIIAIILSRYGYKFSLVSYTTASVNLMLRELGIVLFLASVGLTAGEKFIPALLSGEGFTWMAYGIIITLLPLIITGFIARKYLRKNYLEICGFLAGSMTDPPALAYANSLSDSEAPAVTYATVYPLAMFLRIFAAQLMVLLFL